MRILFITKSNYTSSFRAGRYVELPAALSEMGYEVSLVAASYSWNAEKVEPGAYKRVTLLPVGKFPILMTLLLNLQLFIRLIGFLLLAKEKPDVIITDYSGVYTAVPFALAAQLGWLEVRFVLDIRSPPVDLNPRTGWMKEIEYRGGVFLANHFFDGITAITHSLKDDIVRQHRISPQRIGVWSSGASLSRFDPEQAQALDDVEQFHGKFVVIHHGVLSLHRGMQQTIDAFELLQDEYPDILLFLLGDGPAKKILIDRVQQKELESHVYFHDPVPYHAVPDYLAWADVGIIPLPDIPWWRVSSPQKLMEYLAMQKPVILSDIPAHRNVVGEAGFAVYLSEITPQKIAEGIVELYNRRADLDTLGREGRIIIEKEYTWRAQARRLEAFLLALTGKGIA